MVQVLGVPGGARRQGRKGIGQVLHHYVLFDDLFKRKKGAAGKAPYQDLLEVLASKLLAIVRQGEPELLQKAFADLFVVRPRAVEILAPEKERGALLCERNDKATGYGLHQGVPIWRQRAFRQREVEEFDRRERHDEPTSTAPGGEGGFEGLNLRRLEHSVTRSFTEPGTRPIIA